MASPNYKFQFTSMVPDFHVVLAPPSATFTSYNIYLLVKITQKYLLRMIFIKIIDFTAKFGSKMWLLASFRSHPVTILCILVHYFVEFHNNDPDLPCFSDKILLLISVNYVH